MDPITIALTLAKLTGVDKKIGKWIGGDKGAAIASEVVNLAKEATGEKTGLEALQLIKKDQATAKRFIQLTHEHQLRLTELANADRKNARALQADALKQNDWLAKNFVYLFAIFWSVFAIGYNR